MARVTLRRDDYEDGALPPVCVYSGQPAELLVEHHGRAGAPAWMILLLLLGPVGIVVIVVVDQVMKVEAAGLVPVNREVHAARRAARRRWDRTAAGCAVAVIVGVVGLVIAPETADLWIAVVVVGVLAGMTAWYAPAFALARARPDRTGRHVALGNVHPAFVAAYRAQDDARAEARRRGLGPGAAPVDPWSLARPS